MKKNLLLLSILMAGCASQNIMQGYSTDTSLMRDDKPEGYPKTYITKLVKFPGNCIQTTESWREDKIGNRVFWFKDTKNISVTCPTNEEGQK